MFEREALIGCAPQDTPVDPIDGESGQRLSYTTLESLENTVDLVADTSKRRTSPRGHTPLHAPCFRPPASMRTHAVK